MDAPVATILVLTGLIALFAGLLGSILWIDGKPKGQIHSPFMRLLVGAIGATLIGVGLWSDYKSERARNGPDTDAEVIKRLQEQAERLGVTVKELSAASATHDELFVQLVEDHRVISARTGLIASGQPDEECDRALRKTTRGWEARAGSLCERMLHSMWSIEVVVPLGDLEKTLQQRLEQTGLRVTMADPQALHGGTNRPDLGIVFADDTPRSVVCRIRDAFVEIVDRDLIAATASSTFWRSSSKPGSTHAIRVGVPFDDFFNSGYPRLTTSDWKRLCGPQYSGQRFSDYFQDQADKFLPHKADEREGA